MALRVDVTGGVPKGRPAIMTGRNNWLMYRRRTEPAPYSPAFPTAYSLPYRLQPFRYSRFMRWSTSAFVIFPASPSYASWRP